MSKWLYLILCLSLAWAGSAAASADQDDYWTLGHRVTEIALSDQHGRERIVDVGVHLLLFAPDRSAAKLAHAVLNEEGWTPQTWNAVVYIADISRMPGWVARLIAIPKMKKYRYPVALVRENCPAIPHRAEHLSMVSLTDGRVTAIDYSDSAVEIRARLNQLSRFE